jgi:hypothetical protein
MKNNFYILLLLTSIFAAGCGTATKAYRVVDPRDINKQSLSKTKTYYSTKHKIPYAKTKGVDHPEAFWGQVIDEKWEAYSKCVKIKLKNNPDLNKIKKVKVVILEDSKFECKYHSGRCSGEYDASLKTIFVSKKDFDKKTRLPLLKHEWSHANGILESGHANHNQIKVCTRY